MKLNILLYIPILTFFMLSCGESNAPDLAPEYLYDAHDQTVIKSIINNKNSTISVIYGNGLAVQAANDSLIRPYAGAHYTMVTWHQKKMSQWYGTNMNGQIYSVEFVKISHKNPQGLAFDYEFRPGQGYRPGDRQPDKYRQISFITAQRAAVFP